MILLYNVLWTLTMVHLRKISQTLQFVIYISIFFATVLKDDCFLSVREPTNYNQNTTVKNQQKPLVMNINIFQYKSIYTPIRFVLSRVKQQQLSFHLPYSECSMYAMSLQKKPDFIYNLINFLKCQSFGGMNFERRDKNLTFH